MTRTTNSRIAGITFLFYIVVGITSLVLFGSATRGDGVTAQLASMAQHATSVRIVIVLSLLTCFAALVLAVTLYAITREQDADLAMLVMVCRVAEGVIGGAFITSTLGLLWLATTNATDIPHEDGRYVLGSFLLKLQTWSPQICAIFFALGSTIFSWLLLRGRMVPIPLAWLGVVASGLILLLLPIQLAGFSGSAVFALIWLPMLVFEVWLALLLIIKGVNTPVTR
jgi:hypothetical protein